MFRNFDFKLLLKKPFQMAYSHIGKVLNNGIVDTGEVLINPEDLTVFPEDDGCQIDEFSKGDFEWWYFDINEQTSDCILKIILHVGTNPLRTRVNSHLAVTVTTREKSESILFPFSIKEMKADTQKCNITVSDKILIRAESDAPPLYIVKINIPGFKCNFSFRSEIEGWKPFGKSVQFQTGRKKVDFSWVIPVPLATVDGDFSFRGRKYELAGAKGYHDHNYIKPDRKHPLYMDDLVTKWYWGKCYAGGYTVIFGDVRCRANRILPLMIAENNKIIHSSNNLIDCSVLSFGYDSFIKTEYATSIQLKSIDNNFPFLLKFECEKILDHRDLLEGINPLVRFLIKRVVARPAYHGVLARVGVAMNNINVEGFGNYESMVFRSK